MLPNSKIKAIGLLAAVAVAGFAAGAATMSRADTRPPTDWRERCQYSGMLRDRLGLSQPQVDSIRVLMRAQRPDMDAVMQPLRPQMDSMRTALRGRIREVLTIEQRMRYDSLLQREQTDRQRGDSARNAGGR